MEMQAFVKEGRIIERDILGATMYTCVVWVVNLQMALAISYFTLIQHIFIWGTIALWYIFLIVYGAIPPGISTNAYKVFIETLAPSPSYWILTLFVVISTLIPYFSYSAIKMQFFPFYHEMVQWIRYEGKANDPEFCHMVRQRSLRPTTVGSTARLASKTNSVRENSTNQR
jgi:phospholipid-translocating ATPase